MICERVRSYTLNADGKCDMQEGEITGYTTKPDAPYEVKSLQQEGLRAPLSFGELEGRIAGVDGCTAEEQNIKDEMITKLSVPDTLSSQQQKAQEFLYEPETRWRCWD